jgi:hypothetical protein
MVISSKSAGERLVGLRKLSHIISSMISNIKDIIETFKYVFTKYTDEEIEGIHEQM